MAGEIKLIYAFQLMDRWRMSQYELAEICKAEAKRYGNNKLIFPDSFFLLAYYYDEARCEIGQKLIEDDYMQSIDPFTPPFFPSPSACDSFKIVFRLDAIEKYERDNPVLANKAATQETAATNVPTSHGADGNPAAVATIEQLKGQLDKALAARDEALAEVEELKKGQGNGPGQTTNASLTQAKTQLERYQTIGAAMIKVAAMCVEKNKLLTKQSLFSMFKRVGAGDISKREMAFFRKSMPSNYIDMRGGKNQGE